MEDCIIRAEGVQKSYGELEVLRGVDLEIPRGQVVTIVGASGAGKTTLLQILGTLLPMDAGRLYIRGEDVGELGSSALARFRNETLGFVFQFHHLLPEFTAVENVCLPALIGRGRMAAARARALELLDYLGVGHRGQHRPQEMSGGEQQRVAVARALINDPPLLLADEPSGNLDTQNRGELHQLFFRLRDELGKTFIVVTHDPSLAAQADIQLTMSDGRFV